MTTPYDRAATRKGNVKARRMYAQSQNGFVVPGNYRSKYPGSERSPVFVLPADAENYKQMAVQMDAAISKAINRWLAGGGPEACDDVSRAALAAIGIAAPRLTTLRRI